MPPSVRPGCFFPTTIWREQLEYNQRLWEGPHPDNCDEWTKDLALGLLSEVDELMRELSWKRHRNRGAVPNRENIAQELADITKYVMCLWQAWGFHPEEVYEAVSTKTEIMEQRYNQEFTAPQPGRVVVISDLDGTIANWRAGFARWCWNRGYLNDTQAKGLPDTLDFDLDMAVAYPDYHRWKHEFESDGGYRHLPDYADGIRFLQYARKLGCYVICITARPQEQYKRIWYDTWMWLKDKGCLPDQLLFGGVERVLLSQELCAGNHKVLLLDDDPEHLRRAVGCGATVWGRRQNYNRHCEGMVGIRMFSNLDDMAWLLQENFMKPEKEEG